ncbi:Uncharacterised protein [Mycobacterium tuberculosis]|nr:Uncharacterised protein [Mycobacterium tuberculosis]COX05113.1 Uncharacterised protein [Mycobacterium tuberculosis]
MEDDIMFVIRRFSRGATLGKRRPVWQIRLNPPFSKFSPTMRCHPGVGLGCSSLRCMVRVNALSA